MCAGDGSRLLEEESCLPGTEDYGTTPCGMLEVVGVWEGWALNQFREQSHLSKSHVATVSSFSLRLSASAFLTHIHTQALTYFSSPQNIYPLSIAFCKRFKSQLVFKPNPSDTFFIFSPQKSFFLLFFQIAKKMIQSRRFEIYKV